MSADLAYLPGTELAARIRRGDLSPVRVVDAFLDRIADRNESINAYVTVIEEDARARAREAERAVERGDHLGPLHGVPIALKDLYGFKEGVRHTYCSVPFADNVAEEDATFVERLEGAGAIVLGKTNAPEFGPKGTTDNLLFGPTSTPFDRAHNAGGSSGGSAAAVAGGLATLAHGSDGGGSLRIPASCCGVFAFKPTFRRTAFATRPDAFGSHTPYAHHGTIARSVADAALMLDVMAGPHPRDPFALPDDGTDYRRAVDRSIDGLDVAYTPDFGTFPVDGRVRDVVGEAVEAFEAAGASVETVEVDLGHPHEELTDVWLRMAMAGIAANAERFAEEGTDLMGDHRDDLTDELVRMIEGGRGMDATEYVRLAEPRTDVLDAIVDVFESHDLLVSPTLCCLPPANTDDGHTSGPAEIEGEAVDPQLGWCPTYLMNFSGHPAANVPAGFVDDLPVGMQIAGPRFADGRVLAASAAFERVRPWFDAYPPR